jgi:short-subunit dehydrogenase
MAGAEAPERIRALTGDVEVGLFVHNVGGGGFGPLLDRPIDSLMHAVMINCVNLLKLVHHYGQAMKARGAGGFITFGSMAGNVGGAYMTTYSASKAFTQLLFESLWSELQGSGIDVLSIVIGSADTPSRQRSGTQDNALFPVARPEDVAAQALREIGNGPVQVPAGSEQAFATFNTPDRREAVDTIRRLLAEMSVS